MVHGYRQVVLAPGVSVGSYDSNDTRYEKEGEEGDYEVFEARWTLLSR